MERDTLYHRIGKCNFGIDLIDLRHLAGDFIGDEFVHFRVSYPVNYRHPKG